jgi:tRNA(adenine34) deaminase
MELALEEARKSGIDVPVGALIVDSSGRMLAKSNNRRIRDSDPLGHAELLALREAAREVRDWRVEGCTLYVTLEPCAMCASAISDSRLKRVVFGAYDSNLGAAGSKYDILRDSAHGRAVEVLGGVLEDQCSKLLKDFFQSQRR